MNVTKIILKYLIKASYTDEKAVEILNRYDAERTGKPLEFIRFNNGFIRRGDISASRKLMENYTKSNSSF